MFDNQKLFAYNSDKLTFCYQREISTFHVFLISLFNKLCFFFADFLSLGEPIKVGHHSEKRHRKAIDDAWNNMGKSVEFSDKAAEHERVAKYWEKRAETINLSMPESIDFYEHKLEQAKEFHEGVKSGKYPREHAYTLTYAKKAVNEAQKNYELALKLWGDEE